MLHHSNADLPARIQQAVDMAVQGMRVFCKIDYENADDKYAALDDALSRFERTATPSARSTLMYGACFGEAVRAQHGGRWCDDGPHGIRLESVGPAKITLYPLPRVAAILTDSEATSLAAVAAKLASPETNPETFFPDDATSPANHAERKADDALQRKIAKAEAWRAANQSNAEET